MVVYTHGGWAHWLRVGTTFLTLKNSQLLLVLLTGFKLEPPCHALTTDLRPLSILPFCCQRVNRKIWANLRKQEKNSLWSRNSIHVYFVSKAILVKEEISGKLLISLVVIYRKVEPKWSKAGHSANSHISCIYIESSAWQSTELCGRHDWIFWNFIKLHYTELRILGCVSHCGYTGVLQNLPKHYNYNHSLLAFSSIYPPRNVSEIKGENNTWKTAKDTHSQQICKNSVSNFLFTLCFIKINSEIVEGPKLINIIFMRVYVCMMYVLDTFTGFLWPPRIHHNV